MTRRILLAVTAAAMAASVAATAMAQQSCTRNGQTYPDGSRIGDLKCENGNWVVVQ